MMMLSLRLLAIPALLLPLAASAYVIEEELLDDPVGSPAQDAYKVTISVPSEAADDPGLNTFVVNWNVPKDQTSPQAPADLTGRATFTIQDFTATSLVMQVAIDNTFDPNLGVNSILSFGFYVDPEIESATVVNHDDPDNLVWTSMLDSQLTGNFKGLDVCLFPDYNSNSCNGGNVNNGLLAGASDLLTLTLTGNFVGDGGNISMVMLSEFPVKFQGDWGSYEVPGSVGCCTRVPEPASLALALLGVGLVRRARLLN